MKRIMVLMLALIMLAGLTVGCNTTTNTPDAGQTSMTGQSQNEPELSGAKDTLIVGISSEPTSLNPVETSLVYNDAVLRLIYDNLIRLDDEMNYVPHLAESYEAIPNGNSCFVKAFVFPTELL